MTIQLVSNEKIAETSSKGNQEKWRDGDKWYKLDQFGYEALAEVFTSQLLNYSNILSDTPFRFANYQMERLSVHGRERTGCSSNHFLKEGESIITIAHLFKHHLGYSLTDTLGHLSSNKKRMIYIAEETARITGLDQFPEYLTLLFEIDALVLNDDRHLNNIAVLEKNGAFDYCPIFDQGAGLLSNTLYAPLDIMPRSLIKEVIARPFQTTFSRQIHTMESMYGKQLQIPRFTRKELYDLVTPLLPYYPQRDQALIADRVCETVLYRQQAF